MEDIKTTNKCDIHFTDKRHCTKCDKYICTRCIITNKEEIKHYKEHFDFIKVVNAVDEKVYTENLNDYEGFELLN